MSDAAYASMPACVSGVAPCTRRDALHLVRHRPHQPCTHAARQEREAAARKLVDGPRLVVRPTIVQREQRQPLVSVQLQQAAGEVLRRAGGPRHWLWMLRLDLVADECAVLSPGAVAQAHRGHDQPTDSRSDARVEMQRRGRIVREGDALVMQHRSHLGCVRRDQPAEERGTGVVVGGCLEAVPARRGRLARDRAQAASKCRRLQAVSCAASYPTSREHQTQQSSTKLKNARREVGVRLPVAGCEVDAKSAYAGRRLAGWMIRSKDIKTAAGG